MKNKILQTLKTSKIWIFVLILCILDLIIDRSGVNVLSITIDIIIACAIILENYQEIQ